MFGADNGIVGYIYHFTAIAVICIGLVSSAAASDEKTRFKAEQKLRPGMKTGKPYSDSEFFAALNLDLPELSKVRRAVDKTDWAAARKEFCAFVRDKMRKTEPDTPKKPAGKVDKELLRRADDLALHGKLLLTRRGNVYKFDPTKPFSYLDYDPLDNRELHENIQMYDFEDVGMLCNAYLISPKKAYLDMAGQMISSYYEFYGGGTRGPVAAIRSVKEGEIFEHPWDNWTAPYRTNIMLSIIRMLHRVPLDDDHVMMLMKVLLEDIRLAISRKAFYDGNVASQLYGPAAEAAAMFYEFKEARSWFDEMVASILRSSSEIMPDGSQPDFSTTYLEVHVLWISRLQNVIETFNSSMRVNVPPDIAARYEKLIDWAIAMRKPDGRDVQFNDTSPSNPPSMYAKVAGKAFNYFGRDDLRWFASNGKEGHPPVNPSYPAKSDDPCYAGMYAMRSDWTKDARYLVADFGPFGSSHGHPDYGSFILHAYGADLIEDGGNAAYGTDAHVDYSVTPWAHNIVGIDGHTQTRHGRPEMGKPLLNWITNEVFDYAWGSYDFSVTSEDLAGIVHFRAIYFAKPDYFLLLDRIDGPGRHSIRSKLQLSYDVDADLKGNAVEAVSKRGPALTIQPFDRRCSPTIIKGQTKPFWDGWMNKGYDRFILPSPSVVYEEARDLPVFYQTLLYPAPKKDLGDVKIGSIPAKEGEQEGVLLIVTPPGAKYHDEFVIGYTDRPVTFLGNGLSVRGKLVHIRWEGKRLHSIGYVGTSMVRLESDGKEIKIESDSPADGFKEAAELLSQQP